MANGEGNTSKLEKHRAEVLTSLRDINGKVDTIQDNTNKLAISQARMEGTLEGMSIRIGRNEQDIAENKTAIGKYRDTVRGLLVRASATGGVMGSVAGFIAGKLG